jgi:antitoxin (DNA-binding transcriptional repressor) of toxin-antitoxin stability system
MQSRPTITEFAQHFSEYIDRVIRRGERFVLMRDREPVAELRPVTAGRRLGELPGILASLPHLAPEDLAILESDLAEARNDLRRVPARDPWGS